MILALLSIMIAAVQPNLGFVAIFIGSKIGHKISRSFFQNINLGRSIRLFKNRNF
jgi:hypothetical protein